jgi:hypothetical protein
LISVGRFSLPYSVKFVGGRNAAPARWRQLFSVDEVFEQTAAEILVSPKKR